MVKGVRTTAAESLPDRSISGLLRQFPGKFLSLHRLPVPSPCRFQHRSRAGAEPARARSPSGVPGSPRGCQRAGSTGGRSVQSPTDGAPGVPCWRGGSAAAPRGAQWPLLVPAWGKRSGLSSPAPLAPPGPPRAPQPPGPLRAPAQPRARRLRGLAALLPVRRLREPLRAAAPAGAGCTKRRAMHREPRSRRALRAAIAPLPAPGSRAAPSASPSPGGGLLLLPSFPTGRAARRRRRESGGQAERPRSLPHSIAGRAPPLAHSVPPSHGPRGARAASRPPPPCACARPSPPAPDPRARCARARPPPPPRAVAPARVRGGGGAAALP